MAVEAVADDDEDWRVCRESGERETISFSTWRPHQGDYVLKSQRERALVSVDEKDQRVKTHHTSERARANKQTSKHSCLQDDVSPVDWT